MDVDVRHLLRNFSAKIKHSIPVAVAPQRQGLGLHKAAVLPVMQADAERAAVVPVLEDCCSAGIKRVLPVVQAGVSCRRVLPEYPSAVGFVQQADEVVESVGLTVIGAYADDVEL